MLPDTASLPHRHYIMMQYVWVKITELEATQAPNVTTSYASHEQKYILSEMLLLKCH